MAEQEKRASERRKVAITTIIKKQMPNGAYQMMQFLSHNLSQGGVFILAENLSLFDLGEKLNVLVENEGDKFYAGQARVVRSARVFATDKQENESGYGLMFLTVDAEFKTMLLNKLK